MVMVGVEVGVPVHTGVGVVEAIGVEVCVWVAVWVGVAVYPVASGVRERVGVGVLEKVWVAIAVGPVDSEAVAFVDALGVGVSDAPVGAGPVGWVVTGLLQLTEKRTKIGRIKRLRRMRRILVSSVRVSSPSRYGPPGLLR